MEEPHEEGVATRLVWASPFVARPSDESSSASERRSYREWTRVRDGRLAHTNLTEEQAAALASAIANYREIRRILMSWERATEAVILGTDRRKPLSKRQLRRN